jgi:hypothetical protein
LAIEKRVRFARRRFGHYDVIDFMAVLLSYAISGERTLGAFYESVHPFVAPFMALFGRERLPHRSTLSRFLAALNQATVEAVKPLLCWLRPNMHCDHSAAEAIESYITPAHLFHDSFQGGCIREGCERIWQVVVFFKGFADYRTK